MARRSDSQAEPEEPRQMRKDKRIRSQRGNPPHPMKPFSRREPHHANTFGIDAPLCRATSRYPDGTLGVWQTCPSMV